MHRNMVLELQKLTSKEARLARRALFVAAGSVKEVAFDYYPRLGGVKKVVLARLTEHFSLQEAAKVAGYEATYFSDLFHRRVGVPFKQWLLITRVSRATELMRSCDYRICDVAHMVGFRSLRAFERAFRRLIRLSPRRYKNAVRPH